MDTTNTKFDFDANIKFLLEKNLSNTIENEIVLQNKIMNSSDFNTTFKYIEDSLNFLYEKNRVLQDVIEYSNFYLKNEINNLVHECKTILTNIENNRDSIKNNSYVKYPVPFLSEAISSTDRNNKVIDNANVYNNKIVSATNKINTYNFNSTEIKRNDSNFNIYNSEDELIESNTYRTFYMFKNPNSKPIEELIALKFDNPVTINQFKLNTSNCLVDSIKLILDDESEVILKNLSGIFKTYYVKEIYVSIKCNNYIVSQIDYNEYENNDFWDKINAIKKDENLLQNKDRYYYYLFGIDNIEISYSTISDNSLFISKEIDIGTLKDNEYITLQVDDSIERGDIEYYVIDGTTNIPIFPENKKEIVNEKIFNKTEIRFNYDESKPLIIKKNGEKINLSLFQAINMNNLENDIYTIDYTPVQESITGLNNDKIKIKAIVRNYDKNFNSFINNICIKKYGGGNLWTDKI